MNPNECKALERISQKKLRTQHIKEFALTLLEQCESENMNLQEFEQMMNFMKAYILNNVFIRDLPSI